MSNVGTPAGVGPEKTAEIAARVETFVRDVVVPYEQDQGHLGLVTRLVDDVAVEKDREASLELSAAPPTNTLSAAGEKAAAMLAASPVGAIGSVRHLLLDSFAASLETQCEREGRAISAAGVGPEGKEGVAAFLAKRKPDFKGV